MGQSLWPFPEAFVLGLKQLTFRDAQVRHVTRLSGNSQSRRRNVPFRVSSRSRPSVYAALAHIAQFLRMSVVAEFDTASQIQPLPGCLRVGKGSHCCGRSLCREGCRAAELRHRRRHQSRATSCSGQCRRLPAGVRPRRLPTRRALPADLRVRWPIEGGYFLWKLFAVRPPA